MSGVRLSLPEPRARDASASTGSIPVAISIRAGDAVYVLAAAASREAGGPVQRASARELLQAVVRRLERDAKCVSDVGGRELVFERVSHLHRLAQPLLATNKRGVAAAVRHRQHGEVTEPQDRVERLQDLVVRAEDHERVLLVVASRPLAEQWHEEALRERDRHPDHAPAVDRDGICLADFPQPSFKGRAGFLGGGPPYEEPGRFTPPVERKVHKTERIPFRSHRERDAAEDNILPGRNGDASRG